MNDSFKGPGWCKSYQDGTQYGATDFEIEKKIKSWIKSQNHSITAVSLRDKQGKFAKIEGEGNFWQSDTFRAPVRAGETVKSEMLTRRIEKQITDKDKFMIVEESILSTKITFKESKSKVLSSIKQHELGKEYIGKWLILELKDTGISYYLSENRI